MMNAGWWSKTFAVCLSATLLLLAAPAGIAYKRGGNSCHATNIYFKFTSGTRAWTTDRKDAVRRGLKTWQRIASRNGHDIVRITESSNANPNGPNIGVKFVDNPGGDNNYGVASCSYEYIHLNDDFASNYGFLSGLAAHEMGHIIGLHHAGWYDSQDGKLATMETCASQSQESEKYTPEHDDRAAIIQKVDPVAGDTLHADPSFEDGTEFWTKTNVTHSRESGAPNGRGNYHIEFKRASDTGQAYISQDVRVIVPQSWAGAAYMKKLDSNHRGFVVVGTPWRPMAIRWDSRCDFTSVAEYGDWMSGPSRSFSPATSWGYGSVSTVSPGGCGTNVQCPPSTFFQAEIQMRVRNIVTNSNGASVKVAVDDAAARGQ